MPHIMGGWVETFELKASAHILTQSWNSVISYKITSWSHVVQIICGFTLSVSTSLAWSAVKIALEQSWKFFWVGLGWSYSTSSPVSTGMGDVSGFDSRRRHFISVCNQPTRLTQPFILSRWINWAVSCNRMFVSSHGRRHLVNAWCGWLGRWCVVAAALRSRTIGSCQSTATSCDCGSAIEESDLYPFFNTCSTSSSETSGVFR